MAVEPAQGSTTSVYRPRDPAKTILYRVVQEHFETYLSLSAEGWDDDPVPAYVEREFRRYLECGHDFLATFSCKGHGVYPSCNARRMAEARWMHRPDAHATGTDPAAGDADPTPASPLPPLPWCVGAQRTTEGGSHGLGPGSLGLLPDQRSDGLSLPFLSLSLSFIDHGGDQPGDQYCACRARKQKRAGGPHRAGE